MRSITKLMTVASALGDHPGGAHPQRHGGQHGEHQRVGADVDRERGAVEQHEPGDPRPTARRLERETAVEQVGRGGAADEADRLRAAREQAQGRTAGGRCRSRPARTAPRSPRTGSAGRQGPAGRASRWSRQEGSGPLRRSTSPGGSDGAPAPSPPPCGRAPRSADGPGCGVDGTLLCTEPMPGTRSSTLAVASSGTSSFAEPAPDLQLDLDDGVRVVGVAEVERDRPHSRQHPDARRHPPRPRALDRRHPGLQHQSAGPQA